MFLKNRNISSKIKRSKVTDYAALKLWFISQISVHSLWHVCWVSSHYMNTWMKALMIIPISWIQDRKLALKYWIIKLMCLLCLLDLERVHVPKFQKIVAFQKGIDKQGSPRSKEAVWTVLPGSFSDKHFGTSSPDNQHFFLQSLKDFVLKL